MTRQKTRFVLAIIVIVLGGLIVAALIFVTIPEGNREPLLLALGLVLAWGGKGFDYYFGTSESSAQISPVRSALPSLTTMISQ